MTAALRLVRPSLEDYTHALPELTLAQVRARGKVPGTGNEILATIAFWAEHPGARAALSRLHDRDVHALAVQQVERLQREELERPPEVPEPVSADGHLQRRLDAAHRALEDARARVEGLSRSAAEQADRVAMLSSQAQHPSVVESARSELARRTQALTSAQAELAAAERALAGVTSQARDPERRARLRRLQELLDAMTVETFLAQSAVDFELVKKLGSELERVRVRLVERTRQASESRRAAVELARELGHPTPGESMPDASSVRIGIRRELARGIADAGGNPRDWRTTLDTWNA